MIKRVLERDNGPCQKCGSLENLQIHHKNRRSQEGNDALENLVTHRAHCHMAEDGQFHYEPEAATPFKQRPEGSIATR